MDQEKKVKYNERYYKTTVQFPALPTGTCPVGTPGTGQITLQNRPFVCKRVRTAIIGPNQIAGGLATIADVFQDGQYFLLWKTQSRNFMSAPLLAAAAFSDQQGTRSADMVTPMLFDPKDVIELEMTNAILRQAGINIEVIFEGAEPVDLVPEDETK